MKKRWMRFKAWLRFRWLKWRGKLILWNGRMPKGQPCPKHKIWCRRTGREQGGAWYWCPQCYDGFLVYSPQVLRQIRG